MACSFPKLPDRPPKRGRTLDVFSFVGHQKETFGRYHDAHVEKAVNVVRSFSPFVVSTALAENLGARYKASTTANGRMLLVLRDHQQHKKTVQARII